MKYKAYIDGKPYKMYRGSSGYSMNTYEEDCAIITCRYDDGYFAPHMPVDVDGEVYHPDQNGRIVVCGEKGTRRTLALTYEDTTKYVDVTFNGGTYEVRFYRGLESYSVEVDSELEDKAVDLSLLRSGTWQCVIRLMEESTQISTNTIADITVPLPSALNQVLFCHIEAIFAGLKGNLYYYEENGEVTLLGSCRDYKNTVSYAIFDFSRTGD